MAVWIQSADYGVVALPTTQTGLPPHRAGSGGGAPTVFFSCFVLGALLVALSGNRVRAPNGLQLNRSHDKPPLWWAYSASCAAIAWAVGWQIAV